MVTSVSVPPTTEKLVTSSILNRVSDDNKTDWTRGLRAVKNIMDEARIRYWLDTGTLLGAIREGNLIPWDDDIDLSVEISAVPKLLSITSQFARLGYRVDVTDTAVYLSQKLERPIGIAIYRNLGDKIWVIWDTKYPQDNRLLKYLRRIAEKIIYRDYHRNLPRLEMVVYTLIPRCFHWAIRRAIFRMGAARGDVTSALVLPKRLIDNLGIAKLEGAEFPVPNPPEDYLTLIYGSSWRIPNKNWTWDDVEAIDHRFLKYGNRSNYSLFHNNECLSDLSLQDRLMHDLDRAAEYLNWWQQRGVPSWRSLINKFFCAPGYYTLYQLSKLHPINITARTLWGSRFRCYLPDYFYVSLYGILGDIAEVDLSKFIVKHLRTDEIFLDIGASCGFYSLLANYLLDKKGRVYTFEPTPHIYRLLKENIKNFPRVVANECAVAGHTGSAWLQSDPVFSVMNTLMGNNHASNTISVSTITLDDYCRQNRLYPTFIKIDVEGSEETVIVGGQQIIKAAKPVIAMEMFRDNNTAHLKAATKLLEMGYLAYKINANGDLEPIAIEPEAIRQIIPEGKKFVNLIFRRVS